jgi:sirohydrochlorin cobaltochelatase
VEALVSQGHGRIRLMPLFFGMGKHAREDMPALVQALRDQHPALDLQVMPSAGEQSEVLDLLASLALKDL